MIGSLKTEKLLGVKLYLQITRVVYLIALIDIVILLIICNT